MLPDDDRAAELRQHLRRGVVFGQIEDADLPEGAERTQQRLGLPGELHELDLLARLPEDRRAIAGDETTGVCVVRERPVGALPGLAPPCSPRMRACASATGTSFAASEVSSVAAGSDHTSTSRTVR